MDEHEPPGHADIAATLVGSLLLTMGLLLIVSGCLQTGVGPGPVQPTPVGLDGASYLGEQAVLRLYNEADERVIQRLESGDLRSASEMKAAITAGHKDARNAGYLERDDAFEAWQYAGEEWSAQKAADGLRQIIAGRRRAMR